MLTLAPRVWFRCTQMQKRWPWHEFDAYAGVPLDELRREFAIRVLSLESR